MSTVLDTWSAITAALMVSVVLYPDAALELAGVALVLMVLVGLWPILRGRR